MFNQYGWVLIDWWRAGGTYYTMRELAETSRSKEELAEKIAEQSPFDYGDARRMAEAVFEPLKDQIRHDAEVRAELKNKPIVGIRFGLFPVRKAVAWWVVEDHYINVFLECCHIQEYPIKRIDLISKLEEQGCMLCYLENREGLPKGTLKRCSEAEAISIHSPLTMGATVEDLRVAALGIVEPVMTKLLDWASKHMQEVEEYNKSKE